METRNSGYWSELPIDILRSVLERLSFVDFHRAKIVCSNWYSCSKHSLILRKPESPWLILFQERGGCGLYNPEEDSIYETNRDFSRIRFLANSRNWFLVRDSRSNLYIMDVFSEKKIDLPPLESIKGGFVTLSRVGDKKFSERFTYGSEEFIKNAEDLRGLLWVDEKKEEYVVVWFFDRGARYIAFCKNGEDHYRDIPTQIDVCKELSDMVLHGGDSTLYILTKRRVIRKLAFSKQEGFVDVAKFSDTFRQTTYDHISGAILSNNIAVTTAGEVLLVQNFFYETTRYRRFRLYKKDPNTDQNPLVEVYSLGDEALLMDLGITVPAGSTLGIEPNSIYFTCDDRVYGPQHSCLDICVFNIATKKLKRFPGLSLSNDDLSLKDARWFLPS
ncbi:F-box-like domain superfamily [Arabidopsis suecica]|uniref:F-box-like domain superfamily n=1 Tax=Arabidopsis suecica TaxID=45249 RepID=A0A8T1ZDZ5_ARASU|nr:F-box-like domain superfamily [Arabidopsis suecica]